MENSTPYTEAGNQGNINLTNLGRNIIYQMKGDMNFVGIFSIVIGIINCLTIFGAVIGVPILLAGIRLKDAAGNFDHYLNTNSPTYFEIALEKQKSYFFIMKIMIIITIVVVILEIILLALFFTYFLQYFQPDMIHSV